MAAIDGDESGEDHEKDHEHDHEEDHDHGHEDHHDHEEGHGHHHHHHHSHGLENEESGEALEYGISTFVYYRRRPLDLTRFDELVASAWPKQAEKVGVGSVMPRSVPASFAVKPERK